MAIIEATLVSITKSWAFNGLVSFGLSGLFGFVQQWWLPVSTPVVDAGTIVSTSSPSVSVAYTPIERYGMAVGTAVLPSVFLAVRKWKGILR